MIIKYSVLFYSKSVIYSSSIYLVILVVNDKSNNNNNNSNNKDPEWGFTAIWDIFILQNYHTWQNDCNIVFWPSCAELYIKMLK